MVSCTVRTARIKTSTASAVTIHIPFFSPDKIFDKGMKLPGSLDRERELRIRLLEKLSEECEDELYNEVAMGLDDELFQRLLKKYGIQ